MGGHEIVKKQDKRNYNKLIKYYKNNLVIILYLIYKMSDKKMSDKKIELKKTKLSITCKIN